MSITHSKVSGIANNPSVPTRVGGADWDAVHVLSGLAGAGWVDWSPVIKAGSTTCTWTGTAKYLDLGAMVFWYFNTNFTSDGSSGIINVTNLPSALQNHDGGAALGDGMWLDQGVNFYQVTAWSYSGTEWRFYRDSGAGSFFTNAIGSSPQDSANIWGVVTKSVETFDVPTLGGAIGVFASTSGTTNLGTGSYTAIALDAADAFDTNNFHDPASNNTKATIPAGLGGIYDIVAQAQIANAGSAITDKRVAVRVNGTTTYLLEREYVSTASATTVYLNGSIPLQLNASDYVELMGFCDVASSTGGGSLALLRRDSGTGAGDTDWTSLSYTGSWVTYTTGSDLKYRKLSNGLVVLRGEVKSGSAGTAVATLPVGYRPGYRHTFAITATFSDTHASAEVSTAGVITPNSAASNAYVPLNTVFFADS